MLCRDIVAVKNNTRNAAVRHMMKCLEIAKQRPPQHFRAKSALNDPEYYHSMATSVLRNLPKAASSDDGTHQLQKPPADTACQAWAFYFYVRTCFLHVCAASVCRDCTSHTMR